MATCQHIADFLWKLRGQRPEVVAALLSVAAANGFFHVWLTTTFLHLLMAAPHKKCKRIATSHVLYVKAPDVSRSSMQLIAHPQTHPDPHLSGCRSATAGGCYLLVCRLSGSLAAHPHCGCQWKACRWRPSGCYQIHSADWPLTEDSPEGGALAAEHHCGSPSACALKQEMVGNREGSRTNSGSSTWHLAERAPAPPSHLGTSISTWPLFYKVSVYIRTLKRSQWPLNASLWLYGPMSNFPVTIEQHSMHN